MDSGSKGNQNRPIVKANSLMLDMFLSEESDNYMTVLTFCVRWLRSTEGPRQLVVSITRVEASK